MSRAGGGVGGAATGALELLSLVGVEGRAPATKPDSQKACGCCLYYLGCDGQREGADVRCDAAERDRTPVREMGCPPG